MARRSYDQYCSLASALDRVGDRWTLLLVRELMVGPRRYTDLLEGLPGIGTNQLADRLRRLEGDGLVERRELPPPAAARVYRLTERGRGLEEAVLALARWGLHSLGPPDEDLAWRPDWTVVALRARFDPRAADAVAESYQFVVDGQGFWARVERRRLTTGLGRTPAAAVTVTADRGSFLAVAAGELSIPRAIESGRLRVDGDPQALRRAARIFPPHGPSTSFVAGPTSRPELDDEAALPRR